MNSAAWTWNDTFALVLTGMAVVFLALIILIGIIYLMGKISTALAARRAPAPKSPPLPPLPPQPAAPPVSSCGISDEVVAVITAAVAAMGREEGRHYRVTGIRQGAGPQRAGSRNPWAAAGQLENTRPF